MDNVDLSPSKLKHNEPTNDTNANKASPSVNLDGYKFGRIMISPSGEEEVHPLETHIQGVLNIAIDISIAIVNRDEVRLFFNQLCTMEAGDIYDYEDPSIPTNHLIEMVTTASKLPVIGVKDNLKNQCSDHSGLALTIAGQV